MPLSLAIDAFELLARARVALGDRLSAPLPALVHPVHGGSFVQYRFEAMTVEVANERRVVARVVVFANAGLSFVDAASAQGGGVEAIDGFATRGNKGDVKAPTWRLRLGSELEEREGLLALESCRPVSHATRASPKADVAERGQRGVVERGSTIEVLDAEGEVVEHCASSVSR